MDLSQLPIAVQAYIRELQDQLRDMSSRAATYAAVVVEQKAQIEELENGRRAKQR